MEDTYSFTCIVQVALSELSTVVTIISQLPPFRPVTTPFSSTDAISGSTQYATTPVSSLTQEIVTVPTASVVTFPSGSTVASDLSEVFHVIFLLSEVSGSTVAFSQNIVPFFTVISVCERTISFTGCKTVILVISI